MIIAKIIEEDKSLYLEIFHVKSKKINGKLEPYIEQDMGYSHPIMKEEIPAIMFACQEYLAKKQ